MASRIARLVGLCTLCALAVWWARAVAHSKVPSPEGHWRELDLKES